MKKSNKIVAVLLALVMIISAVPMMTAMAEEEHVHSYKVSEKKDATCTNPGFIKYECTDVKCKNVFVVPVEMVEHKLVGSIKKNNDETHKQRCDTCDGWIYTEHTFVETVKEAATCGKVGKMDRKCSACGYEEKNVEIAKVAHTYTTIAEKDITATQHMGVCTVCNDTVPEAHKWDDGVVTTKPQCNKAGVLTKTCTVCKKTTTVAIPAKHTLPETATVSKDGKTHVYTCAVAGCGYEFKEAELVKEDKTTAHKLVVVEGEKSLCDESVALTVTCKDCNYKLETKATQHEFKDIEKYDSNSHKQVCKKCNLTVTAPHNWEDVKVTKVATCKEAGEKEVKCKDCKETATVAIPKLEEHKWDAGTVTTEATCGKAGVKTFKCSVCELTKTEEIAATGTHTWGEWKITIPATPITDGTKIRECSVCGQKETDVVKYEETVVKPGDVNGNGSVEALDARIVLQYVAQLRDLTDKEKEVADMNNDGEITAYDARLILQVVAGLK